MHALSLDPSANLSAEALSAFLLDCQSRAKLAGQPLLVSISLVVGALDPLAVLESIYESSAAHFYLEKPSQGIALAGAEAVLSLEVSGPSRFEQVQRFVDSTLARTLAVGLESHPLAGPLFFCSFTFASSASPEAPFEPARVFVPCWQVAVSEGRTVATANLLVQPEQDPLPAAMRVWRAHNKFRAFSYTAPKEAPGVPAPSPSCSIVPVGGPDSYQLAVAKALSQIELGAFNKIVLARAQDLISSEAWHPLRVLNSLRQRFSECYAFSVANGRGQSFIGATPERLLRVQAGRLYTEALAGSTGRGLSASEDAALAGALLRNEKELREHRCVADSIIRRLTSLGFQLETLPEPRLRRLANVQHLLTPIEASLPQGVRLLDVLASLHPTPAVGGSPRDSALPLIKELEGFERGLYAGAIGWLDSRGNGEFCVGLRSALIDGCRARLYAGAGIVAGSNPQAEFLETELKIRAMRDAITESL